MFYSLQIKSICSRYWLSDLTFADTVSVAELAVGHPETILSYEAYSLKGREKRRGSKQALRKEQSVTERSKAGKALRSSLDVN